MTFLKKITKFQGKTVLELCDLEAQISSRISKGGATNAPYWEGLLEHLKVYIARTRLRDLHGKMLRLKLTRIREEQMQQLNSGAGNGPSTSSQDTSVAFPKKEEIVEDDEDEDDTEELSKKVRRKVDVNELEGAELDDEQRELRWRQLTEDQIETVALELYERGRYSPPYNEFDDTMPGIEKPAAEIFVNPNESKMIEMAKKGMDGDEATFAVEEQLETQKHLWSDKYRPRKPTYLNRVQTGFDWNKYNQTHYDMDNPPPKIVQGYKFNIFYPDLLDKTKTPTFTVTPCDDPDFAIVRFKAGPPYEDIAFKIVNREWEVLHKNGYKCQFQNGVFQLCMGKKKEKKVKEPLLAKKEPELVARPNRLGLMKIEPELKSKPQSLLKSFLDYFLRLFFTVNDRGFVLMASVLMIIDAAATYLIIQKVPYTEIDWSTYMQQVECYTKKRIYNYSMITGDTGPIVYPGGHLHLYHLLYRFTNRGKNIKLGQNIFMGFYLVNLLVVMLIYRKSKTIPPIVLPLLCLTGYRIHSIFVLRLFNDPVAMLFFYLALSLFLSEKWLLGSFMYSLAVSVKMNVLLFAPALFFTYLIWLGPARTFLYISVCAIVQLYVGLQFLAHDPISYIKRSFDLGRVFFFQWTVNWRFLPESLFLDPHFHGALLVGHVTFLAIFAWKMWFRSDGGLPLALKFLWNNGIQTHFRRAEVIFAFFTANLIGITFSRSLHYQFYSWYYHQLPYLLFWNWIVKDPKDIPWRSIFWKVLVLLGVEVCWNVYPSTVWSSALLHVLHVIILVYSIHTRLPVADLTKVSELDDLEDFLSSDEEEEDALEEWDDVDYAEERHDYVPPNLDKAMPKKKFGEKFRKDVKRLYGHRLKASAK
ncbi:unnamed protein product [Caenorhabditis auriculariae]|uniref:dolichyl-P-Man:Man5GlcNAc2-PP-dolichol alpha-1,3-mannosyltransferase n=1 Tax=Caenorhabditis auriculariae TaxID=2777116 RepID=A0A8S1H454_9PELO|nr:unnamed protein product [Caenorhabditis auriculariae]